MAAASVAASLNTPRSAVAISVAAKPTALSTVAAWVAGRAYPDTRKLAIWDAA